MDAIVVERVSKRFRIVTIPKHATIKEALLKFQFPGRKTGAERFIKAVDEVSFSVPHGSRLGIVGKNGSGKTTLLRLLAGIYAPDSGLVRVSGSVAPLLSLGVGFHPDMTGRENLKINGLVLGLSPRQIESLSDAIIEFAEMRDFIDVPVRAYSSGMYMRLAYAVAASVDPDVLLLDEILSVGDEAFAAKCLARMNEFKERNKTIVLVTHDPTLLLAWCENAIWMDRGSLRMQGPAAQVIDAYHRDLHSPSSEPVISQSEFDAEVPTSIDTP
jgi:lipopolysaccharide transport system ATP-binding protein